MTALGSAMLAAVLLFGPPEGEGLTPAPEVQRPGAPSPGAGGEPVQPEATPAASEASPAASEASPVDAEATPAASEATPVGAEATPAASEATPVEAETSPVKDSEAGSAEGPVYYVVPQRPGPPYYTPEEQAALRARYGLGPVEELGPEPARFKRAFRCFLADPSCGFNVEINASSAYAYRLRQGDVSSSGNVSQWSSGRAQYDLWINFVGAADVVGTRRYTRLTLGPKGGVAVSDGHSLWGNLGLAMRAYLGRGSWAPTVEFTTALSFALRGELGPAEDRRVGPVRSPVGLTADLGFGVGGLGAIIFGGQFDPPLAREDLPERIRVPTGGMFFVGFRGNILWGAPAAAAVATHALTQRGVTAP